MKWVLLLSIILAVALGSAVPPKLRPLSDEFINSINSKQTTWKAGRNFKESTSIDDIKKLLGVLPRTANSRKLPIKTHEIRADIPETFDAREAWPLCADIIGNIRDQAACGSCWAFGAVEAMSDRICIHSEGEVKVSISAEDLNTCCTLCGSGCNGGWPEEAWYYWSTTGIVTGGAFNTTQGCKAYTITPCDHHVVGNLLPCDQIQPTPACTKSCDVGSTLQYNPDLRIGSAYGITRDILQIQAEILTNGPVEADFTVYEDFPTYKSGVYQHVTGDYAGGHAIKILGWGVEDGTPYWLVANSWNTDWGQEGYFKILRGANECGIEADILGGLPAF